MTQTAELTPTQEVYTALQDAFDKLNEGLFGGKLPQVVITLQRKKNVLGYYCKGRFGDLGERQLDEIAMNPQYTNFRDPMETLSTLAHEMVHQWQHEFGTPTKTNHHNREWGAKMTSLGLPPRPVKPGGPTTGNKVTHGIDPDGPFAALAPSILSAVDLAPLGDVPSKDPEPVRKSGSYVKFQCPCCKAVARGAPSLKIACTNHDGDDAYVMQAV